VQRSPGSCSCLAVFPIPYVAGCTLRVAGCRTAGGSRFWLAEEMDERNWLNFGASAEFCSSAQGCQAQSCVCVDS
jgi:hypothetical protein